MYSCPLAILLILASLHILTVTSTLISSGPRHSCGVMESGIVNCWGLNQAGEINVPAGSFKSVVSGGDPNGGYFSCAIQTNGKLSCWGQDTDGQATPPDDSFSQVATGQHHACGIKTSDQSARCWGKSSSGEANPPQNVQFTQIATALTHSCGLTVSKKVACW